MTKQKAKERHVRIDGDAVLDHLPKVEARIEQARRRQKKEGELNAQNADRHDLYQNSVQSPEADARFLARVFKKIRGRKARHLREDFCGTAYLASTWVEKKGRTAEGLDLDPDPLAWGILKNFPRLGKGADAVLLRLADVREPSVTPPDVRCAQNFSWFVFKERPQLLEYFKAVRADLPAHGVFVMDIQGGPESMQELEEETDHDEFSYVWDQKEYVPTTREYQTRIHYRFPDGSELTNAFLYDWRLWGLPETIDLLREAGFETVTSYWEGTDKDGESGNGVFRESARGENCEAWVTYIVAYS